MSSQEPKKRMRRKPLTVANILNQKIERISFEGDWYQAFKKPQNRGVWFVYGGSGSGKSTFMMQLSKELAKTYKTLYDLLEEETDDSDFIERTERCKMQDVQGSFHAQRYDYNELNEYLNNKKSANVIVIDSAPYFFRSWDEYWRLKRQWASKKIIIIVGHADGKNPSTELQKRIMYDAKMKIFVSGYLATCKGRTIGPNGGRYIIWKEGYEALQGKEA